MSTVLTPLPTGSGPLRGDTYVPSTPESVLWGRLPCERDLAAPVARVAPGSEVTFDTLSHEGILEDQGRDPRAFFAAYDVAHVLDDAVALAATDDTTHPRRFGVDGPHVVSRPVHVDGAVPGDLLAVTVVETLPRVPYGVISNRHGKGALPGEHPLGGAPVFSAFASVSASGTHGQLPLVPGGERLVEFPLAPFLGTIGVTVPGDERPHSVPPGPHGGNIDIRLLTVGATLYLPVQVAGWNDVQPADGALLVNLGDLMARWTNEEWLSTVHRVKPPIIDGTIARRRSAAYFHDGNIDAVVETLPSCVGEGSLYEPITVAEHLRAKLAGSRAGVSNAAAEREAARVLSSSAGA